MESFDYVKIISAARNFEPSIGKLAKWLCAAGKPTWPPVMTDAFDLYRYAIYEYIIIASRHQYLRIVCARIVCALQAESNFEGHLFITYFYLKFDYISEINEGKSVLFLINFPHFFRFFDNFPKISYFSAKIRPWILLFCQTKSRFCFKFWA